MLVKQIMTGDPVTCARHQTLNDAARQMWDHDVGAVPIVDEQGEAVGVITDRDICMAAYTQGSSGISCANTKFDGSWPWIAPERRSGSCR